MNQGPTGPPERGTTNVPPGGLSTSLVLDSLNTDAQTTTGLPVLLTLADLPTGARLILRCRKDWRTATVSAVEPERVVLSVASPTGNTYRVRRPPDSLLSTDGPIPVLGEGCWRAGFARYDARW